MHFLGCGPELPVLGWLPLEGHAWSAEAVLRVYLYGPGPLLDSEEYGESSLCFEPLTFILSLTG